MNVISLSYFKESEFFHPPDPRYLDCARPFVLLVYPDGVSPTYSFFCFVLGMSFGGHITYCGIIVSSAESDRLLYGQ
jgi:hypothetical protein